MSGDGKTLMIVNLSPSTSSAQESLCSLRFASQVNKVELGAPVKVVVKSIGASEEGSVVVTGDQKEDGKSRSRSVTRPPLSGKGSSRSHSSGR